MNKFLTLCFVGMTTLVVAACDPLTQPEELAYVRATVPTHKIANGDFDPALKNVHEFALMSEEVYKKMIIKKDKIDKIEDICENLRGFEWEKIEGLNEEKFLPGPSNSLHVYKVPGFQYTVWRNKALNKNKEVSIAFRGTDPKEIADWYSNLRWITRFVPVTWDQYDQTRDLITGVDGKKGLIDKIQDVVGKDAIISTNGHSLGGGLAQQAAYVSDSIKTVYAFDPSSVTGFYSVDATERKKNQQGLSIFRIYERGEVLAILRWGMSKIYPIAVSNPKISEVRYNFKHGENAVTEHSMRDLACSLVDVHKMTEEK